ncbi:hypothetical protein IWQ61_002045 [Dispira simplex]|nr:hypothetical protein IWQ61_002045 [Dispira simplex]
MASLVPDYDSDSSPSDITHDTSSPDPLPPTSTAHHTKPSDSTAEKRKIQLAIPFPTISSAQKDITEEGVAADHDDAKRMRTEQPPPTNTTGLAGLLGKLPPPKRTQGNPRGKMLLPSANTRKFAGTLSRNSSTSALSSSTSGTTINTLTPSSRIPKSTIDSKPCAEPSEDVCFFTMGSRTTSDTASQPITPARPMKPLSAAPAVPGVDHPTSESITTEATGITAHTSISHTVSPYDVSDSTTPWETNAYPEACSTSSPELDAQTLRVLGGRRAIKETIKFKEINQASQLTPVPGQATAQVAMATRKPSRALDHLQPSQSQKQKNNIMHLAFQALENEGKLKEMYAMNRKTKRETKGKYGF